MIGVETISAGEDARGSIPLTLATAGHAVKVRLVTYRVGLTAATGPSFCVER
jgi:hypothetical protein